MVWVGRDLKDHLVPTPPAMGRDIFHQPRLLRAPSNMALNTAREGAATASLGNLGQCLTTLMGKNFFPISHQNLPSFSLEPFPHVLSLHTLVKSPSPSFLSAPTGAGSQPFASIIPKSTKNLFTFSAGGYGEHFISKL